MPESAPRSEASPETTPARSPDWTLGDWIEARVILPDIGAHFERLADKWGKNAVARVLARLEDLRKVRSSLEDVRSDLERAGDIASARIERKAAKAMGVDEVEVERRAKQACPASISEGNSVALAREVAKCLDAIAREATDDPDPWRNARWRQHQTRSSEATPKRNAYAELRAKRDVSNGAGGGGGF